MAELWVQLCDGNNVGTSPKRLWWRAVDVQGQPRPGDLFLGVPEFPMWVKRVYWDLNGVMQVEFADIVRNPDEKFVEWARAESGPIHSAVAWWPEDEERNPFEAQLRDGGWITFEEWRAKGG